MEALPSEEEEMGSFDSKGGVMLFSHSLIKVLAVRFRFPGESFVSTGHGISLRSSIIGVILNGRGVASEELADVSNGNGPIIT